MGRTDNKGMEGLALTPDGKTLVGIMQAPLIQDSGKTDPANKTVRIVTIDIATGAAQEYAYNLTTGSGVSDIIAQRPPVPRRRARWKWQRQRQ